ncbi:MAG: reverse transcriptase-like protein [Solibacillus sp.]
MELMVEWHYVSPKGLKTIFHSESLPAAHVLVLAEDLQKTGRVGKLILTDAHDSTWTVKELKKYVKEMETEPQHIQLYFDGGYMHGERLAGLGCAIYYEQNGKQYRLRKNEQDGYVTSSNEAEYAALYFALCELELLGAHHQPIEIYGDSQVVIHEMRDDWAMMDAVHEKWAEKIETKLTQLGLAANYMHIERRANQEADQLATQALEGTVIEAKIERMTK